MKTRTRLPAGFTLIEVLIVIAIIGLLVGLLVPAVSMAYRTVKQRSLAMEVVTIADAVEKYQQKYGDYPPDGSSGTIMTRHFRKIFPQIAQSELDLLTASSSTSTGIVGSVMDPAEALVFFLGGFSDDPVYPFTGAGGPLSPTPSGSSIPLQYNVDRNSPLYEFKQSQLSLVVMDDPSSRIPITVSNDESDFGFATPPSFPGDLMPVYRPNKLKAPFVYFDSRTYSTAGQFNRYQPRDLGVARPYKSDEVNTNTGAAFGDSFYRYASDNTFQVISAGLDDSFGGVPTLDPAVVPVFFRFPSGLSLDITLPRTGQNPAPRYTEAVGQPSTQLDNATSFSGGILDDSIPE